VPINKVAPIESLLLVVQYDGTCRFLSKHDTPLENKPFLTIFYGCTMPCHKYRVFPYNAAYTHACKEMYLSCPRALERTVLVYV